MIRDRLGCSNKRLSCSLSCGLLLPFGLEVLVTSNVLFAVERYLAQLHNMSTKDGSFERVEDGKSWWSAETAIPRTLAQYAALGDDISAEWRSLMDACAKLYLNTAARCAYSR